jgi:5-methylthioribose kinase
MNGALARGARTGGQNMAFRKTRYTDELDESVEEVEGKIREFVQVVTNPERQPGSESELAASNINSVLQRVTATSVQEIDALISELESSRDMLHSEAARVQREIVQYSTLIQGALHSTKIIAESLTQWKKVPDAQTLSD